MLLHVLGLGTLKLQENFILRLQRISRPVWLKILRPDARERRIKKFENIKTSYTFRSFAPKTYSLWMPLKDQVIRDTALNEGQRCRLKL